MIIIDEEFLNQCKAIDITVLQLAYLIHIRVLPTPMQFVKTNGKRVYLFDDFHFEFLQSLLKWDLDKRPRELRKAQETTKYVKANLQVKTPGLSEKLISIIESEQKIKNPFEKIPYKNIEDLFGDTKKNNLLSKILKFPRKFPLFQVKLDGKEQVQIITNVAIAQTLLPGSIIEFYFFRIRPINYARPFDNCLKEYVVRNKYIGWGQLDEEIALIKIFGKHEPKLFKWQIGKGLRFIRDIEAEYKKTAHQIEIYRKHVDPEGYFIRLLAYKLLSPGYEKIVTKAFTRTEEQSHVILSELEKNIESTIEKLVEIFLKK
jgi:hypothetical protein